MQTNVIWVSPSNIVKTAVILMKGHKIGALPVVHNEDAVVGILTYQSLLGADPSSSIIDVMEKTFSTIPPETPVPEAAEVLSKTGESHLLVVQDGRLAGIVSHGDLLPELGKSYDPLTELPWSDSMRDWSMEALKGGTDVSVIFMDLNNYREFNKRHGHITGDLVLKTVAEVLKSNVDPRLDFLCRYGGDEFVIASLRSIDQANEFGNQITSRIAQIQLQDVPEGVTASFGVFGGRRTKERLDIHFAATLDDLINRASKNCTKAKPHYQQKEAGLTAEPESEPDGRIAREYEPRESRLKIDSINFSAAGPLATVDVTLSAGGNVYSHSVKGYSVGRSALRLVAEATAGAVSKSLPEGYGVVLDEILTYGAGEEYQLITTLAVFITPKISIQSIGTSVVRRGDAYRAAAAAILCALNRHIASIPRVPSPQTTEEAIEEPKQ